MLLHYELESSFSIWKHDHNIKENIDFSDWLNKKYNLASFDPHFDVYSYILNTFYKGRLVDLLKEYYSQSKNKYVIVENDEFNTYHVYRITEKKYEPEHENAYIVI